MLLTNKLFQSENPMLLFSEVNFQHPKQEKIQVKIKFFQLQFH
jgi:hypothetical protein